MSSLAKSTRVNQADSHTYTIDFDPAWTIGTGTYTIFPWKRTASEWEQSLTFISPVPHGGYVTAVFMRVVSQHFSTTLARQNQPHTIALHLDFLRRTQIGPATFKVKDVKLGRQTSVVHVTLLQDGREEVVGYITNSNISTEEGVSFSTAWKLQPAPLPADLSKFESDEDPNWAARERWPFSDFTCGRFSLALASRLRES
jgi:hypothetical protein